MAGKVKLTQPMTDSKTPEWADVAARALDVMPPEGPQLRSHRIASISQALLSAYERGRAEKEWQDISTAPTRESVLVCNPGKLPVRASKRWGKWKVHLSDLFLEGEEEPTLFMPLPAPPAKENDNER